MVILIERTEVECLNCFVKDENGVRVTVATAFRRNDREVDLCQKCFSVLKTMSNTI